MKFFKEYWGKISENYTPTFIAGVIVLLIVFVIGIITSLEPIKKENDQATPKIMESEKEYVSVLHVFDGDTFSVKID